MSAGFKQLLVALHHAERIQRVAPHIPAERHREEAAVLVGHGHQLGEERDARRLRAGAAVAGLVEAPELLGVVPAEEVRVAAVEVLKRLEVSVLDVRVAAAGGLAREPHAVELAHRGPRLIGAHSVLRHLIDVLLLVVLA